MSISFYEPGQAVTVTMKDGRRISGSFCEIDKKGNLVIIAANGYEEIFPSGTFDLKASTRTRVELK